jgi:hypothetical protein
MNVNNFKEEVYGLNHVIQTYGLTNAVYVLHAGADDTGHNPLAEKYVRIGTAAGSF